jgi:hypothetical protein
VTVVVVATGGMLFFFVKGNVGSFLKSSEAKKSRKKGLGELPSFVEHWCSARKMVSAMTVSSAKTMKTLDVSNMEIVLRGKQWDRAEDPCCKQVMHLLERNEGLVTWLQPKVLFLFYLHFIFGFSYVIWDF